LLENIEKLRERAKLPVFVYGESNLRYYTGVAYLGGGLLIDKENILLANDMEMAHKVNEFIGVFKIKENTISDLLKVLKERKIKRLGVELPLVSYALYKKFQAKGIKLVDASKIMSDIREIKTEEEIRKISKACELADKAMKEVVSAIRPGASERQIRTRAMSVLTECEDVAFSFIIASGPNSEYTHVYPSDRRISSGELIIVDLGFKVDGYCSDLTRTFCINPSPAQKAFYSTILEAQKRAAVAAIPGIECDKVRGVVEDFFRKDDLLDYWKYSLGHGVGLEVHEPPYFFKGAKEKLKNNMTFTLEPGLHIPGTGGIRIEDTLLLDKKPIKLTDFEYSIEP
jgi:Xaa-Pro aminopeptidase